MKPISISEKLQFTTIRIESSNWWTGTWFYFQFKFWETTVPIIITNKHVVNDNENEITRFSVNLTENNEGPLKEKIDITFDTKRYFHPEHDLCFSFCNPLFEQVHSKYWKDVFYRALEENIIYHQEKLEELTAIENIIMIWYPNWLRDQKNNLPIFRKWITASHPAIDFNRDWVWCVDMACFPWSSWSPIFILNEWWYSDKKWNTFIWQSRVILLWILFAWPQINTKWEIVVESVPTQNKYSTSTPLMMHLGYYIKAQEILSLKSVIQENINT